MILEHTEVFRIKIYEQFQKLNSNFKIIRPKVGRPRAGFGILNSVFEIGHKYDLKCFCALNYHSWRFVLVRIFLSCFFMANFFYLIFWTKSRPAQWFFKTWIQLLKLLINLIRNASVCSNIILKILYWSEFEFLVSLWLNFHFFVFFSDSRYF